MYQDSSPADRQSLSHVVTGISVGQLCQPLHHATKHG